MRDAAAEGRINLAELDIRLEQALSARTHADLAPLTADLPRAFQPDPGVTLVLKGGLHGASRAGVTIVIPDGWAVETGGLDPGLGGLRNKTTAGRLPNTPLIRVSGTGGSAGVVIRHPNRRERRKLESNPPL